MASNPPFPVEDNTDEDFFDKLVNDDDDMDFKVTSSSASGGHPILTDGSESDEVKAFANLSINELDDNSEVNFDNVTSGNHEGVGDLSAEVERVEHINKVDTGDDRGDPLMVSSSFEVGDAMQKLGNEDGGGEVPYDADSGKSASADSSDATMVSKSSGGSGAPGVKEVDWSAFHADSTQNDSNGFGSYSDFFGEVEGVNAGDAFSSMVGDSSKNGPLVASGNDVFGPTYVDNSIACGNDVYRTAYVDNSNNYGQDNKGYNDGVAADQGSNLQDLSTTQYWENQYPGWRYDHSSGQWYQIDGYDVGASVQANADFSYMLQTAQPVTATVAEVGVIENVTSWNQASQVSDAIETTDWNQVSQVCGDSNEVSSDWNQASHDNNGYPPHMVFDPQYPGWYYDTIAQEWRTLESYTQSTVQVQDQMHHDGYSSADTFSQNNNLKQDSIHGLGDYVSQGAGSQSVDQAWAGTASNYNQQNTKAQQPETISGSEATSLYNGTQLVENNYGQNVTMNPQQSNFHYGVKGSYYESRSQHQNDFSVPPQFVVGGNLSKQFNDSKINQNDPKYFYSSQNSLNFSQQPIQNAQSSYAPATGRSSAGRPAHALVTFGFGGKLIVMKNNNTAESFNFGSQSSGGGSISVLNLSEVMNGNIGTSSPGMGANSYFQALCQQSVPGPLTGGNVATKELNKWFEERITKLESANMDYRKAEILRLLLSLLKIACQYYGKLRSPYGTDAVMKESDSPESAVAKLFASAKRNGMQFSQFGNVAQCLQQLPSEGQLRVTAAEVQNLLVSGRKKEALQCAQEGQLWGPALVLAAQLGDQFYVETVKQMALRQLVAGSPLRTLCLLIAGQPADVFSSDSTSINSMTGAVNVPQQAAQFGANGMLDDWEENLAVITANRTKDDELVLIHLGDCLWKERSDIIAAHICYLVAEAGFEPYSDSARLCLVGADHWKFPRTYASPEAIQRTEIYEYSKTIGNSQFVLLPFQPYKYVYAHMLAEVGRMPEALKYCQAVLKSLKTGRTTELETLRNLVSSLEERIKAHQQGGFSANLAPKEFIGKLLNLFDSTAHRVVGGLPPAIPTPGGNAHGNENHYQPSGPRVSTSQSTMAMSSLVPSQSMEPINEWAADNRKSMHTRSVSEPDFGRSPLQGQADSSKEASSTGVHDKASAAGGTSRFSRFNFGSQLLQKTVGLVLRPRQGRQAKLGETNKFYYDEKLKRWVEEGAEPPAEETALAPPPTTAPFQNGASDYNLKSALQSEGSHNHGSPEFKSPSSLDNNSGMPPLPPTTNQYSARGRMGVRSRYVDTFNKGGGKAPSTFQSPSVASVKPPGGNNPKFFVPAPVSTVEKPVDTPVNNEQNTSTTYENPSTSQDDSFQSPAPSSSMSMQRFSSLNNISNNGMNDGGSFAGHSRRTASWSGSFNDSLTPSPRRTELKPLGEVLGIHPSSFMPSERSPSSANRGNFGDLHEVEL